MISVLDAYKGLLHQSNLKEKFSKFYVELDDRIVPELFRSGYSAEEVKEVLLHKSPSLRNQSMEYVEFYIRSQLKQQVPAIKEKTLPIEKCYQLEKEKWVHRIKSFFVKEDQHMAMELIDKGYSLKEIQQCILKESPFAKEFSDVKILFSYCDQVVQGINQERVLRSGKMYELAQDLYLKKVQAIRGKYAGYKFNEFQEGKVIVSMMVESHFFGEVLTDVIAKNSPNSERQKPEYAEKIIAGCEKVKDAYIAIQLAKARNFTSVSDLYKLFAKEYLAHTNIAILTGKDDQKIMKRLFAEGIGKTEIMHAMKECSPVAMEVGRIRDKYLNVTLSVVEAEHKKRTEYAAKNYTTTVALYKEKLANKERMLKNKQYAFGVDRNRSYYDGLIVRELLDEKQYIPNIIRAVAELSPMAIKASPLSPDKTPEGYAKWLVSAANRVGKAEKTILEYTPKTIPKGYSYQDLKNQGFALADLYRSAIKERVETYPSAALNLSAGYMDKDACEKLLQKYPDIKREELEQVIHEASPRAHMPGVPQDYPALVVGEVLERMERVQERENRTKDIQSEYMRQCGLASEGVEAKAENMLAYHDGRAATTMLIEGSTPAEIYTAICEGAKILHKESPEEYAKTIVQQAEKVRDRLYDIESAKPIETPKTAKEEYQQAFQEAYKVKPRLSSQTDVDIATEMLFKNKYPMDEIIKTISENSPIAIETGRDKDYLDFVDRSAKTRVEQEEKKLKEYTPVPRMNYEEDIEKEYSYQVDTMKKYCRLPVNDAIDAMIAKTLLQEGFNPVDVAACLDKSVAAEEKIDYGKAIVEKVEKTLEKVVEKTQFMGKSLGYKMELNE